MDQVSGRWLRLFPGDSLDNIAQGYSHSLAGLKAEHLARYFDRQKPEEFSRGPIPARLPATLRKENPVEPAYLPLAEPVFFSNYGQAVKYCHLRDNVMVENLEQDVVLLA